MTDIEVITARLDEISVDLMPTNKIAEAVIAALNAAGLVVVSKEPTDVMIKAGVTEWFCRADTETVLTTSASETSGVLYDAYKAMIEEAGK